MLTNNDKIRISKAIDKLLLKTAEQIIDYGGCYNNIEDFRVPYWLEDVADVEDILLDPEKYKAVAVLLADAIDKSPIKYSQFPDNCDIDWEFKEGLDIDKWLKSMRRRCNNDA